MLTHFLKTTYTLQICKQLLIFFTICTTLALIISCDTITKNNNTDIEEATLPNKKVYVAFAGGGWRAHTGHSAWVISLLNKGESDLHKAFSNVGAIGSNSGGSWFNTMLMYSDTFASDIQDSTAIKTWGTTGWLGQQRALFNKGTCSSKDWWEYFPCIYKSIGGAAGDAWYWDKIVEDIVYKDYPLHKNGINFTLNDPHLDWAKDKPLLLAASLLKSNVVLNRRHGDGGWDHRYYRACLAPSEPHVFGTDTGSCSGHAAPYVSPVTFSSIPSSSGYTAIPFLSATHAGTSSDQFNLGYSEDWAQDKHNAPVRYDSIKNPLNHSQVPVMIAAASSSAAGGFLAMESVAKEVPVAGKLPWNFAYEMSNEALSFQLKNNTVTFVDATPMNIDQLASNKVVRIADGGPVDNTGVAQLVSFLQKNGKGDNFNIVAFDNVETPFQTTTQKTPVGVDIANLFGQGLKNGAYCVDIGTELCVDVPNIQIFKSEALETAEAVWPTSVDNLYKSILYTPYSVTTKANSNYGIEGKKTGTLHVFTCFWKNASVAPFDDADFDIYQNMFDFINSELNKDGGVGLDYLKKAMGIK